MKLLNTLTLILVTVTVCVGSITACVGSDPAAVYFSAAAQEDSSPGPDGVSPDGSRGGAGRKDGQGGTDPTTAPDGAASGGGDGGGGSGDAGSDPIGVPDSGGNPGGGIDSGGGGTDPGGPGGEGGTDPGGPGGNVVSNNHNWFGWDDPNQCPAWETTPYSWKEPRSTVFGSCSGSDAYSVWEAFFGPNASQYTAQVWIDSRSTCAACAVSDWNDPTWGPIIRTPNGHYILNQAGCLAMMDPGRKSCALSHWQFRQCGKEACDSTASQADFQACVNDASNLLNGVCGEASYGAGRANNVLYVSSADAWNRCVSAGPTDSAREVAARIVLTQCGSGG